MAVPTYACLPAESGQWVHQADERDSRASGAVTGRAGYLRAAQESGTPGHTQTCGSELLMCVGMPSTSMYACTCVCS